MQDLLPLARLVSSEALFHTGDLLVLSGYDKFRSVVHLGLDWSQADSVLLFRDLDTAKNVLMALIQIRPEIAKSYESGQIRYIRARDGRFAIALNS
jgi:hypothetical protein